MQETKIESQIATERWRQQRDSKLSDQRLARVLEVRGRLSKRRSERAQKAVARIIIGVKPEIKARAERGCRAVEGCELIAWLRENIRAFSEAPGAELPDELTDERKLDPTLAPFLEQDRDFAELVVPYVATLPPGCDVTIPELFDVMEIPSASRNRRGEMTLGRILRRLKFTKRRELRNKKVVSLYRKPWG